MSEKAITTVDEERLHTLAAEINTIKRQTQKIMMEAAVEIGRRLVEAKGAVGHGGWGAWLEHNVDYSERTAQNLIRIFQEYGEGQQRLFGESNPQAFADLTYTQAVALLGIKNPDERAEFVESHDVANMTSRGLADAIKERDEAENRAKGWEEKYQLSQQAAETAKADAETARENLEKKEKDLSLANQRLESLNIELKELKDRPIDVAVQDASEEQIAEAEDRGRKQAEKELTEQLKKAERDAEQALEALEAAKRDARKGQADQTLARINFLFQEIQRKQEEILTLLDDVEQEKKARINAALEQGFRTLLVRMEVENNAYKS